MQVVSNRGIENATPPVGCSSRNSVISSNNLASSVSQATPAVIGKAPYQSCLFCFVLLINVFAYCIITKYL